MSGLRARPATLAEAGAAFGRYRSPRLLTPWFGVTMLFGDRLLGIAADRHAVPISATARTLGTRPGVEF